jgi:uncharacterized Zn-finger protein
MAQFDLNNPPPCPGCGKPPWRKGRMAELRLPNISLELKDGQFTVCMHCSRLWKLVDGQWAQPTQAELYAAAGTALGTAALDFGLMRAHAKAAGVTLEDWMDLEDKIRASALSSMGKAN